MSNKLKEDLLNIAAGDYEGVKVSIRIQDDVYFMEGLTAQAFSLGVLTGVKGDVSEDVFIHRDRSEEIENAKKSKVVQLIRESDCNGI